MYQHGKVIRLDPTLRNFSKNCKETAMEICLITICCICTHVNRGAGSPLNTVTSVSVRIRILRWPNLLKIIGTDLLKIMAW